MSRTGGVQRKMEHSENRVTLDVVAASLEIVESSMKETVLIVGSLEQICVIDVYRRGGKNYRRLLLV